MTEMNRRSVLMVGAGSYLSSNVMTNDDLSEFVVPSLRPPDAGIEHV